MNKFFDDPRVYISLLAVLLSLGTFIWNLKNQWLQNRLWQQLNDPNPSVTGQRTHFFTSYDKVVAEDKDWGYDPILYESPDDINRVDIPYYVGLKNPETEKLFTQASRVYTVKDAEEEKQKLNIKGPVDLIRVFRTFVEFENLGKTTAQKWHIKYEVIVEDSIRITSNEPPNTINLAPGQKSSLQVDFNLKLGYSPTRVTYRITSYWIDNDGKACEQTTTSTWDIDINTYTFHQPNI